MKFYCLLCACMLTLSVFCNAQTADTLNYTSKRYNEVGLNAIGMLQMLPFVNGGEAAFDNVAILWRYHWPGKKANLRIGLGGRLSGDDNSILNLRIGRDKIRQLGPKWQYMRGWEWFVSGNSAGLTFRTNTGYAWINGLRYDVNDRVSISTEAHLTAGIQLGQGSPNLDVRIIPLGSLYLNYRLFK